MSEARSISEAESPKGVLRLLSRSLSSILADHGYKPNHHAWALKRLPANAIGTSALAWVELCPASSGDSTKLGGFALVFHETRGGSAHPWRTWRVHKMDAPEGGFQQQARQLILALLLGLESAHTNAQSEEALEQQVEHMLWSFENDWSIDIDVANAREPF